MLSRLPLENTIDEHPIDNIYVTQIDCMPISAEDIREATNNDPILNQVVKCLQNNKWPNNDRLLKPYYDKRNELVLQNGIVMWGLRVIIPSKYRSDIISELHDQHPGIVRMKMLSRIHVWYPGIDVDIEKCGKSCHECQNHKTKPVKTFIHPWNWPTKPFDRVHVDFFTLYNYDYLLLVDSHSKWLEVERMQRTTSTKTIQTLRRWFAQFGTPVQLVSDNGPQFTSDEFAQFIKGHQIKHIRSSAYHPSSNGGAERFVQTVKNGFKKCHMDTGDVSRKLDNFLFKYRTTPSTVTGRTPSELFLNRQIRSRLEILKPEVVSVRKDEVAARMANYNDKMRNNTIGRQPVRQFQIGDKVLVKNHIGTKKWILGRIAKKIADRTYLVNLGQRKVKRHIDDLRRYIDQTEKNNREIRKDDDDDDSWTYGDLVEARHVPQEQRREIRRYPVRIRRPVERYGINN